MPDRTVIPFPRSTSPASAATCKRGVMNLVEMKASIASNAPPLIEDVRLQIVSNWRRGVKIAFIAKMYQLTVLQAEAILWCAYNGEPNRGPSVRQSRQIHLVSEAKAA